MLKSSFSVFEWCGRMLRIKNIHMSRLLIGQLYDPLFFPQLGDMNLQPFGY
jgi:hypothetical protein